VGDERKLSATYYNGEVRVNVGDLFSALDTDGKRDLAQRLACEEDVIAAVVDQLITGSTENGSSGWDDALNEQRRRVIDAVGGEILIRVVKRALNEVEWAKKAEQRADREKNAVIGKIRDFTKDCPQDLGCRSIAHEIWGCRPEWESSSPVTDTDALAFIEKVACEIDVVRKAKGGNRA